MNYFTHGYRFIDDPYFLAGTAVPDWLSVVDRKVRARPKAAGMIADDEDPQVAAVAAGVVQHHHDDDWFHRTGAFAELSLHFTVQIRDVLPADDGLRPSFLGHILVELLLDAALIEEDAARLEAYYAALDQLDPRLVQHTVNRITTRGPERLAEFIDLFRRHRFLFDYPDDDKLLFRLNQVMRRVKLPALPPELKGVFPAFRRMVRDRRDELLTPANNPA